MYSVMQFLLRNSMKRWFIIAIVLGALLFCIRCVYIMAPNIWAGTMIDEITKTLNGIATMFVALGVLLEERETILKMSKAKLIDNDPYLNCVAHENGLGLLLLGLFMEISTILIEVPNKICNTDHIEKWLFLGTVGMVILSILIMLDLVKDYVKTYFKTYYAHEKE